MARTHHALTPHEQLRAERTRNMPRHIAVSAPHHFMGRHLRGGLQSFNSWVLDGPAHFMALLVPWWATLMVFCFVKPSAWPWAPFVSQANQGDWSMSDLAVTTLYVLVLLVLTAYTLDVLSRVPLRAPFSYPLVGSPDTPLSMYDFPLMVFCAGAPMVGLSLAEHAYGPALWHGLVLMGLALLLEYVKRYEPALGFMKPLWLRTAVRQMTTPVADEGGSEYAVPFVLRPASRTFADIHGMAKLKAKLLEPGRRVVQRCATDARNGILLHGEPGNGKTVFAEALAGELGVPFMEVTCGPSSSMWLGQTPQVLSRTFALARRSAPCVMFVDEIDSFVKARNGAHTHTKKT